LPAVSVLACLIVLAGAHRHAHAASADAPAYSYEGYATLLKEYVSDQGLVKYAELKANRAGLDAFVSSLSDLDTTVYDAWDDKAKIAFWCNAYNAITLKYILDNYPITKGSWANSLRFPANSIRQISGVWDTLVTPVLGKDMTLEGIENDILRGQFKEMRIHMAIVCASIGCPYLRNEPYMGDRLEQQLDDQARRFMSNPDKFRIDREKGAVYLSPIFDWFGKDFVDTYTPVSGFADFSAVERAVLSFVSRYVSAMDSEYLSTGQYSVRYLDYDWSLNEQK
jgi:hypothetical protein